MPRGYLTARVAGDGRVVPGDETPGAAVDPAALIAESEPALVERIRAQIVRDGPISFARFMEAALYDPERGYYVTSASRGSRSGDFLTAPEVHPIFGEALAAQLTEMWERLGRPTPFTVREHGAGSGALGVAILDGVARTGSSLLDAIRYEALETVGRRASLEDRFASAGWSDHLASASGAGASDGAHALTGCVLANELLDALPVHRVRATAGGLVERLVDWGDGWFREVEGPLSEPRIVEQLEREGIELEAGEEAEVGLAWGEWVEAAARSIERGYLLLIDYGHPATELYGARRRHGTLRSFRAHHAGADPFRAVGRQDLTAHVDLTAVERAAAGAALRPMGRTTQAEFLVGCGIGDLLEARKAETRDPFARRALLASVVRLVDPSALGGFAVLAYGRGVPAEPPLRGFSFRLTPP